MMAAIATAEERRLVKRDAGRRKLLNLLPRNVLEELSGLESPWHANKADLMDRCARNWVHDDIKERIEQLMEKVK